jgi:ankyrin repeat protein
LIACQVGWSPLHYASANGSYLVVKLLIEKGADVNAKNMVGAVMLRLARVFIKIVRVSSTRARDLAVDGR